MMHLQREPRARRHDDMLDLKALAAFNRIVKAPGTTHLAVRFRLGRCCSRMRATRRLISCACERSATSTASRYRRPRGSRCPRTRPVAALGSRIARSRAFEDHTSAPTLPTVLLHASHTASHEPRSDQPAVAARPRPCKVSWRRRYAPSPRNRSSRTARARTDRGHGRKKRPSALPSLSAAMHVACISPLR